MTRYFKIKNGIECQVAGTGKVLTVRRCREIKGKKQISTKDLLSSLGVKSY